KGPGMAGCRTHGRFAHAGALLAGIFAVIAVPAAAEVRIDDAGGGQLVIEAQNATGQEILGALGPSRTHRFKASDALTRHVTGTYVGTLPRVLSRILDGYDHVIRTAGSGIQIDIVGVAQSTKMVASATAATTVSATSRAHGVSSNVDADEEPPVQ